MDDVFARLASRLGPELEPDARPVWGDETVLRSVTDDEPVAAEGARFPTPAPSREAEVRPGRPQEATRAVATSPGPRAEASRTASPAGAAVAAESPRAAARARTSQGTAHTPRGQDRPMTLERAVALLEPGTAAAAPSASGERRSESPGDVTIEIGQIIVRPPAPAAPASPRQDSATTAGTLSLSDYLAGRR